MPQARLPDINLAMTKYRNLAVSANQQKQWIIMHGALHSYNGLFPEEYQVTISTEEYEIASKVDITYVCLQCKKEIEKERVEVFDLIPNGMGLLLVGSTPQKTWNCPECYSNNDLQTTTINKTAFRDPTYYGVVPNPPNREYDRQSHNTFDSLMRRWGLNFLAELDNKAAKYRDDNWKRGDEDFELGVDGGEEQDAD